jgi:outer membrane protein OmpA-like peptidoglycan-associated protein
MHSNALLSACVWFYSKSNKEAAAAATVSGNEEDEEPQQDNAEHEAEDVQEEEQQQGEVAPSDAEVLNTEGCDDNDTVSSPTAVTGDGNEKTVLSQEQQHQILHSRYELTTNSIRY